MEDELKTHDDIDYSKIGHYLRVSRELGSPSDRMRGVKRAVGAAIPLIPAQKPICPELCRIIRRGTVSQRTVGDFRHGEVARHLLAPTSPWMSWHNS
jgi:hypothetical protein